MAQSRSDDILDFAEREMRKNGFDAVSFRDIAQAIGIKSASVHYHFPTKADLSAGVAKRYAERFIASLGEADDRTETIVGRLERLSDAYIAAFQKDTSACLCTVLGSVMTRLPAQTSGEVRQFYTQLSAWVSRALVGSESGLSANVVISLLQGAMVLAIANENDGPLHSAKAHLVANA